ncbi:MAG: hypothetical protein KGI41_02340 [Patescibacteria group bacterium]|nr:hypothetical protein [Patescibacteria group bacterium]MDE1966053.1 hypothetical protein [Patescibacteria group bacterium]
MFEGFKRKLFVQPEDTTAEADAKRNRQAKAGLAATVGALAGVIAAQPSYTDLHQPEKPQKQERGMDAQEQAALQQEGPHGATVTMNEKGQAVVNIPVPEGAKAVGIDLHEKTVDIKLEPKVVDIDLNNPAKDERAPE